MGDVFSGGFESIAHCEHRICPGECRMGYAQTHITSRKREQIGKPEMPSLFLCEAEQGVIFQKSIYFFIDVCYNKRCL